MFNKIQIDLLKMHLGPFLFCLFTVMFILLMQFLILHVDKLVGKGLPVMIVIELIINNLAYMVVLAVPMAVLVSTLMAFGRFSEWNELTAIRAAGINPVKLMTPVIAIGFILFLSMAYFSNYILPESNHKARSLFLDIRMQKPGFDLQPGVFYEDIEGYTFLVKEIDSQTDSLYDVRVFQDDSDNRYEAYINAKRGWLETPDEATLSLHLHNGSILRYIPGNRSGEETLERSEFGRYRMSFDLSDLAFSRSNPERRSRNDRTMSAQAMLAVVDTIRNEAEQEVEKFKRNTLQNENLPFDSGDRNSYRIPDSQPADTLLVYETDFLALNKVFTPDAQIQSINRVINNIEYYKSELDNLRSNLSWREFRIAEYLVEVHKKISIPFACIVFVFLGAPIGMLTRKGNLGIAALISAVLLTFYFMAVIQGEKFADRIIISPFMGMWGINLFLLVIGLVLTLHIASPFRLTNILKKDE
ncbi:MAG: LptF/LptG family permease [Balneolaceae bacterium]